MNTKKKVMVIGFDGASPSIVKKALSMGKMPYLQSLLEESGNSLENLRSTIPSSTAPSWTSMMTGVNPGKHGIFDFLVHEGFKSRPAKYSDVKKPFVWDILSKHGLKSIVIGHPVTYPVVRDENVIMISGILAPELNENSVNPPELVDTLNKMGYMIDIEDKMVYLKSNPSQALEICNDSAKKRTKASKKLLKDYEWDFSFILFPESDRLLHYHITKEDIVMNHFKVLDDAIRELTSVEDDLTVFITSDHGFITIKKVLAVNVLLNMAGLCEIKSTKTSDIAYKYGKKFASKFGTILAKTKISKKVASMLPGEYIVKERSKAWFTPYAESGIRLNPNIPREEKEKIIESLLNILNNLKDPETGEHIVNALKREDVYWGEETPRAPEVVLIPKKEYIATHVVPPQKDKVLFKPKEVFLKEGDHVCEGAQNGILGVSGAHIEQGKNYHVMDITPTVLRIFGISPSEFEYMDGRSIIS